jgi:hypothetical protein
VKERAQVVTVVLQNKSQRIAKHFNDRNEPFLVPNCSQGFVPHRVISKAFGFFFQGTDQVAGANGMS